MRWAEVDLAAVRHNARTLRAAIPSPVRLCGVVKADAYGHGAVAVAAAALAGGVDWLAVATAEEAMALAQAPVAAPLLLMGRAPADAVRDLVAAGVRLCVYDRQSIDAVSRAAGATGRTALLHLKVDTGMARLGAARGGEVLELARRVDADPGLELEGFWTHFAEADDAGSSRTGEQLGAFLTEVQRLHQGGIRPQLLHCSNSAAALLHPEARLDLVRCGLPLYGYPSAPGETIAGALRPVLTWKARVVALHDLAPGDRVGYGGTFTATVPTQVATISAGYADGYSRQLSNRAEVLIRGRRAAVVGTVSMDYMTADVSTIPGLDIGEEVVLLGQQGDLRLGADEVAGWRNTIAWEVLCDVGKRVTRVQVDA